MTVPELFFLAVRRKIIRISHFLKKYILISCGIQFFLNLGLFRSFYLGRGVVCPGLIILNLNFSFVYTSTDVLSLFLCVCVGR